MTTFTRTITGTSGNDMLVGSDGNDHISSTGGKDEFKAGGGDDYLYQRGVGAHLEGGAGNDIIDAGRAGTGQYHLYGASGNDTIRMDLTNKQVWGHVAHVALHEVFHTYGGHGDDTFNFVNRQAAAVDTMARLDDFHPTRDKLMIEGQAINLGQLPAGMRVVSYLDQQWLHINNDPSQGNTDPLRGDILIGLSGPRQLATAEEVHFPLFPTNVDALPTVAFIDENYVPRELYAAREGSLKKIASSAASVTGTEGADYIYGVKDNSAPLGLVSTISGLGGDDVIDAGAGHDTVRGDAGNDIVAGGLDKDNLLGGSGNDRLMGGSEDDRLEGQEGNDTLDGGTGADDFVFAAVNHSLPGAGQDTIWGFARGKDDIVVSAIDTNTALAGNQAFVLDVGGTFTRGEIRQTVSNGNLLVEFNTDADTSAEMAILLQGMTSPLAATDFEL